MKDRTEEYLKEIMSSLPMPLYWVDGALDGTENLPAIQYAEGQNKSEDLQTCICELPIILRAYAPFYEDCDYQTSLAKSKKEIERLQRHIRTAITTLVRRYALEQNDKDYYYKYANGNQGKLRWRCFQAGSTAYKYITVEGSITLEVKKPLDCCYTSLIDESKLVNKKEKWYR